jgi:hypothetical protein
MRDDLYAKVSAGDTTERAEPIAQGRTSP